MSMQERLTDGRFAPGNTGGPGRPPKPVEEKFLRAIRRAVRPEDMAGVMRRMLEKALDGDVQAAKLLLSYSVGPPPEPPTQGTESKTVVLTVKWPDGWGEDEFEQGPHVED